jgi:hypothetical protein
MIDGKIVNLHQYAIQKNYHVQASMDIPGWITTKMDELMKKGSVCHADLTTLATECYEKGLSALDVVHWIDSGGADVLDSIDTTAVTMCYDKIKSEYRCEKLLLLYLFDLMFLRENKNIADSIAF